MEYMQIVVPPLKIYFHITDTVILHDILCVCVEKGERREGGRERSYIQSTDIRTAKSEDYLWNLIARLACNNQT